MVSTTSAPRARIAVIGKGLIGSAAARHLARQTDGVVLIGPDEPAVRADHHDVFGSHYDEGRIYRILDGDQIWGRLAERSIARYAEIETQSGIHFYQQVGMLAADLRGPSTFVAGYTRTGEALNASFDRLTGTEMAERFPYLNLGTDSVGLFELPTGGYISPRRMVEAQAFAAERHGAMVVREAVHTLTAESGGVAITTASGQVIRAERAVVATGGFANVHAVLPRPLDIVVRGRTVLLAEVAGELLESLRAMPSLIVVGSKPLVDPYLLPPIQYPDGRWYAKIGTGELGDRLDTLAELGDWFRSTGAALDRQMLTETLISIIPSLADAPMHTDTCAVTATASGYPYVELIADGRICLAVGGNGKAAKSADDIGCLAANLALTGSWQDDLPAEAFRAHFQS